MFSSRSFLVTLIIAVLPLCCVCSQQHDTVRFEVTSNLKALSKAYLTCYANQKYRETVYYNLKQDEEGKYFFEYILKDAGLLKLQIFIDYRLTFRYEVYVARKALKMTP